MTEMFLLLSLVVLLDPVFSLSEPLGHGFSWPFRSSEEVGFPYQGGPSPGA